MAPLTPLGKLGQITQGVTLSRHASKKGSTYRVIASKDLENLYVKEAQETVQLVTSEQIEKCQLREGDVVIVIRGAVLKASVVTAAMKGSLSNQNTVFFRPNSENIEPLYLAVLLRSSYFKPLLASELQRSSTTLAAISVSKVRTLEIPLPNLNTQKEIAELFLDAAEFRQVMLSKIDARQNIVEFSLLQALETKI